MERQQELFGEFKDAESKNNLFGKVAFPEKTFTFTFTRERLTLLLLGFIVLLAITFALGFEHGKRSISTKRGINKPLVPPMQPLKVPAKPQEMKTAPLQTALKPYTIQVATFKSKELAQQETGKLRKKGFSTAIIGLNGLYQVWVGEYADLKEASQMLNTLKTVYKDCYIRKR